VNRLDMTHECDRRTDRQVDRYSASISHGSLCRTAKNLVDSLSSLSLADLVLSQIPVPPSIELAVMVHTYYTQC